MKNLDKFLIITLEILVVFVILFSMRDLVLSLATPFKKGDIVLLTKTSRLIPDWNTSELDKSGCQAASGFYKIDAFSSRRDSVVSESISIMWIEPLSESDCEGWIDFSNPSLKKLNK